MGLGRRLYLPPLGRLDISFAFSFISLSDIPGTGLSSPLFGGFPVPSSISFPESIGVSLIFRLSRLVAVFGFSISLRCVFPAASSLTSPSSCTLSASRLVAVRCLTSCSFVLLRSFLSLTSFAFREIIPSQLLAGFGLTVLSSAMS